MSKDFELIDTITSTEAYGYYIHTTSYTVPSSLNGKVLMLFFYCKIGNGEKYHYPLTFTSEKSTLINILPAFYIHQDVYLAIYKCKAVTGDIIKSIAETQSNWLEGYAYLKVYKI